MRILVYDPEYISLSTDVVRIGLLPELRRRVERLVWMLPESRHEGLETWFPNAHGLELSGFAFPKGNPMRWLDAGLRRMQDCFGADLDGVIHHLRGRLLAKAAVSKARRIKATWIFCPSFMNQPLPKCAVPLAGMIYDVNPVLSRSTLANIDAWVGRARVSFAISNFTRTQVIQRVSEAAPRIHVVPPAVSRFPKATRPKARERASSVKSSVRFLCPAALSPWKGQETLLRAARHCLVRGIELELCFCGGGTEQLGGNNRDDQCSFAEAVDAYRQYVAAGGRARALGQVGDHELEILFEDADCVVFPSRYEGFGMPVAEAVLRGLPVIASDLPPIREQLELYDCHDRVRLVPSGDVPALATAIVDFVEGNGPLVRTSIEMADRLSSWKWEGVAEEVVARLRGAESAR